MNKEGILAIKVKLGREWWRIVGVYVNNDLEIKIEDLREWMKERKEETSINWRGRKEETSINWKGF